MAVSADEVLAARLRDLSFAVTYATLLTNSAEAHETLGEGARADELLGNALRALETHKESLESHPALGRVLSLVAYRNLAAAMAVTSEGLFRSALDKLEGPHARYDPRYRYECALAKGGYGLLLCKWERREGDGKAMLEAAAGLLDALPAFPARLPLSAALVYPGLPY